MYDLEMKQDFVVLVGKEVIGQREALEICNKVDRVTGKGVRKILVDVREVDLNASKFDILINHIASLQVDKIALVLDGLISKFKFGLWSRKYKPEIKIRQFEEFESAEGWLIEGGN